MAVQSLEEALNCNFATAVFTMQYFTIVLKFLRRFAAVLLFAINLFVFINFSTAIVIVILSSQRVLLGCKRNNFACDEILRTLCKLSNLK